MYFSRQIVWLYASFVASVVVDAFVLQTSHSRATLQMNSSETELKEKTTVDQENPLGLTPELKKIVDAFEAIGDDKLRYKQLLFMANQAKPMDPASQIPENQVPGCLSTVYVDGTAERTENGDYNIHFVGDSDGLLTKGLVALLVRGLSGNSAQSIQNVDPAFIQKAGISTSLTPGRNNGFLNMLKVMKRKALELDAAARSGVPSDSSASTSEQAANIDGANRPMYNAIVNALQKLQPQSLELNDVSYQHAGHMEGGGTETHFELDIVADAFDGLNLVKRHKLVYMMLGDVMPKIHALQIRAKTPAEQSK